MSADSGGRRPPLQPKRTTAEYARRAGLVTKAALSVTADGGTKSYGATDPAFTATYSGFVNSETPAVLGGTLTFNRAPGETSAATRSHPAA